MPALGAGGPGIEVVIGEQCVHVWRDVSQTGDKITQRCVRCNATRVITVG